MNMARLMERKAYSYREDPAVPAFDDGGQVADVPGKIFETPVTNGGFPQEQTLAKIRAMTEMRT